jgi:hypothetical protein
MHSTHSIMRFQLFIVKFKDIIKSPCGIVSTLEHMGREIEYGQGKGWFEFFERNNKSIFLAALRLPFRMYMEKLLCNQYVANTCQTLSTMTD